MTKPIKMNVVYEPVPGTIPAPRQSATITIRLTDNLLAAIEAQAKVEGRSLSGMVRMCLAREATRYAKAAKQATAGGRVVAIKRRARA